MLRISSAAGGSTLTRSRGIEDLSDFSEQIFEGDRLAATLRLFRRSSARVEDAQMLLVEIAIRSRKSLFGHGQVGMGTRHTETLPHACSISEALCAYTPSISAQPVLAPPFFMIVSHTVGEVAHPSIADARLGC